VTLDRSPEVRKATSLLRSASTPETLLALAGTGSPQTEGEDGEGR